MKQPEENERELTRIRVAGVPEHFNLPWQLGLERRAFVRAALDVKWRTVPQGTGAMCDLLEAGEVDVALLVTEGAVRYILQGGKARIVSAYVDSPLTWGVHVGAGSHVESPEQLKGCRFAISRPNSGSHLAALAYARARGWAVTESDLILVNDLNGAVERLKEADPVAFLWEKFTTKPLVDRGALHCVDEFRTEWPAFMVVVSEAFLAEHGDHIRRLLKVIHDQANGLMQKKTAPEMVAHRYGLTLPDAHQWFGAVRWNTGAPVDPQKLGNVVDVLAQAGMPDLKLAFEAGSATLLAASS